MNPSGNLRSGTPSVSHLWARPSSNGCFELACMAVFLLVGRLIQSVCGAGCGAGSFARTKVSIR